ncbi:hypothetical protein TSMEX_006132 [Taenia solium]|eukprot:TsM_000376900 transcript=TsM_000376900 gene=TsM_000376900
MKDESNVFSNRKSESRKLVFGAITSDYYGFWQQQSLQSILECLLLITKLVCWVQYPDRLSKRSGFQRANSNPALFQPPEP